MKLFLTLPVLLPFVAGHPAYTRPPTGNTPAYANHVARASSYSASPSCTCECRLKNHSKNKNSTMASGGKISGGWYPGWYSGKFPSSQIPWSKYTQLTYAFAIPSSNGSLGLPDGENVLVDFVTQAHSNNVSALVSVGGWTGSTYFSSLVATPANRTAFATTLIAFANKYKLNGLDFDWEYPGRQGMGCNVLSGNDSANFLELLNQVRAGTAKEFLLTAAVGITPFAGPDGNPMTNVSAFAAPLNHVAIMAYDIYGPSSTIGAGPNAPLNDTCAPKDKQTGSCVSAVNAWKQAGFPANQILLGVPSYGHSYTVESSVIGNDAAKLAQFPMFNNNSIPLGTGETSQAKQPNACGIPEGNGGVFDYNDMVNRGFIDANGTPSKALLSTFDNCSQTEYIYNSTSQVLINYDTTETFKAKGNLIKSQQLGGFAMWHIASDTTQGTLASAISSSM